jgi:hypothetical protein
VAGVAACAYALGPDDARTWQTKLGKTGNVTWKTKAASPVWRHVMHRRLDFQESSPKGFAAMQKLDGYEGCCRPWRSGLMQHGLTKATPMLLQAAGDV